MSARVEQLHYTWTPRGVEGINRFQIAAMSSGLSGPARSAMAAARKICRYERPKNDRDASPTSFGWFDHREHRIAFCRVGLPPMRGKVGNFAAHVLVGPPAALPEAELATTFGSPFWWTGLKQEDLDDLDAGKRDFELPPVDFDDVLNTRREIDGLDRAVATGLVHTLLTLPANGRLTVVGDPDLFGRALRVVGRHVPEALEGRSLSTYEASPTVPFRVMGSPIPAQRTRECSLAEPAELDPLSSATLDRLLSPDSRQARLSPAARNGNKGRPADAGAFWARARALVDLVASDGATPAHGLLETPEAIAYLSGDARGRAHVADAVHRGSASVRHAVRAAGPDLEAGDRTALYEAIAERYSSGVALHGCAGVASVLVDEAARTDLRDRAARTALSSVAAARSLGADDAVLLVDHTVRCRMTVPEVELLLRGTARHVARCAEARPIPDEHVAAMLQHLLPELDDPAVLAATLAARPLLLAGRELGPDARDACLRLLPRLDDRRLATALRALLPHLAPHEPSRTVALLHRLTASAAAECILDAPSADERMHAALDTTCDDLAAVLLGRSLTADEPQAERRRRCALDLLQRSRSPDHPLARQLLTGLLHHPGPRGLEAARSAAALRHASLGVAIFDVAIERALVDVRRPSDVTEIWHELRAGRPGADETETLRLLLQRAIPRPGPVAKTLLLAWMARDLLAVHDKLLAGKRLRDRELQELAEQLAGSVPEWRLKDAAPYAEGADRRSRGWWRGLAAHR